MGGTDKQPPRATVQPDPSIGTSNTRNTNGSSQLIGLNRTISQTLSTTMPVQYKLYRRRFFGLAQLMLLNIVVSWDWIALAPVSSTAATYFDITETAINWLSTIFMFAFVIATPFTFFALNKYGVKTSIVVSACLLLVGNWVKYGGTRANNFGVVMLGQILVGFAQPFVLSAPTSYSNQWFNAAGRTTATALASLANPFGAALGQLISPFWATSPAEIPNTILYISLIATVACLPSFFIPSNPPTPPAPNLDSLTNNEDRAEITLSTMRTDLKTLFSSVEFYLIFIPFSIYVGFINAFSSLLNQILEPYGFSEDDAGIAGAILIVVGLVFAAISSPFMDKYKFYLLYIKVCVPLVGLMYLIFVWAPATKSIPYVYVVCAVAGAVNFGLVPVVLEFLVEMHYPLSPDVGSTACWCGGQLLGGLFIVIMDALKASKSADPPENMSHALIFQAVMAVLAVPLPLCLGLFGRKDMVRKKRWEAEQGVETRGHVDFDSSTEEPYSEESSPVQGQVRI